MESFSVAAAFSTESQGNRSDTCRQALVQVRRRDLLGLIIVKELALLDLEAGTRVGDVKMRSLPMLRADTAMYAPHDTLYLYCTTYQRSPDLKQSNAGIGLDCHVCGVARCSTCWYL